MNEWKTVRLGDVCEILNGYAFKSDKYVDSGIRVIRITNVQKGFIEDNSPAFYPITEKETLKDYELHENDLLISLTGNVGRVALLSKEMLPAALNQRVGCIRIRDKNLLISYLFTFLNSDKFESDCIYSARGIAQKNMSTEWLKNYLIPLPPIEVQIKIANNLNTCSKIIKKHNKQLNNFDLLIKSRFIEMFGDPVQNPMGWEVYTVEECATKEPNSLKAGPFGSSLKKEFYVETGYKIYGQEQVISGDANFGDYYIDEKKFNELKSCEVKANDVLISLVGTYGKLLIIPQEFQKGIINPRLLKITFDKSKIDTVFFKYFFASDSLQKKLTDNTHGGTMGILNLGIVRKIKIPVPPLSLQNDFASFVQQIDKSKFEIANSLKRLYNKGMLS